ncbi:MAG: Ig domain-containing protein [Planctomycetota bacterium]
MSNLNRALTIAVAMLIAITLTAAPAFAQSKVFVDPDNPFKKVIQIGEDPPAPTQPDLGPSSDTGYAWQASGTGSGLVADFPADFKGQAFRYWAEGKDALLCAPKSLIQRDAFGNIISSETAGSANATSSAGTVRYTGTWPSVDDVFTPLPGKIKHDTIIHVKPALSPAASWFGTSWHVTIPEGMEFCPPVTEERVGVGPLQIGTNGPDGTWYYSIGMVVVIDADGNRADGQLRIAPDGNGYLVSVEVPASFMRGAAYPVAIDPVVELNCGAGGNWYPYGGGNPEARLSFRYDKAQINMAGTITAFAVRSSNAYPQVTYPHIVIRMGETTKTNSTFSNTWDNNFDAAGPVTVFDGQMVFNAVAGGEWFNTITFDTPYAYSGNNALTFEISMYGGNSPANQISVHNGTIANQTARRYLMNKTIVADAEGGDTGANTIRFTLLDTPQISSPAAGAMTDGYVGTAYNVDVDASGGQAPLAFDISAGSLPAGLSINSTSGIISGNPTTPGNSSFTVRVTDNAAKTDTRDYTIDVYSALQLASPAAGTLQDGIINTSYGPVAFSATGGKPSLTWSITAGSLPPGVTQNPSTGALSGTPTTVNPYNFTVRVTDANGQFAEKSYTINIYDTPIITSPAAGALVPEGYVGDPFSLQFNAAGGFPAYTWSLQTGSLPAGLALNPTTGLVSGNPTTTGSSAFTIRVTDTNSDFDQKGYTLQILSLPSIASPAPGALPQATRNAPNYSQSFTATGGKASLVWSASGLPAGMSINSGSGVLTGTPTASGSFNVTITLTDANGKVDNKNYTLQVAAAVSLTGSSLPDAEEDLAYSQTPGSAGGTSPYTWTMFINPSLPDLTIDPATGLITGTPAAGTSNNYTVTVTLTDSLGGTANKNYTFYITQPGGGTAANCGCNSRATTQDSAFTGWLFLLLPLLLLVARRRTA